MGKEVIKKSKATGGVRLVEVTQLSIGVRTRAKTQALRGLLHQNSAGPAGEGSYLQLRNRRLQKPPNFSCQAKPKPISKISDTSEPSPTPVSRTETASKSKVIGSLNSRSNCLEIQSESINLHVGHPPIPVEASSSSLGENVLEFEGSAGRFSDRRTRESTPSSSSSSSTRNRSRFIPTTNEMDRFFLGPEQQQQSQFIEKYNFDPMNDKPLPGRFEWKKLK